MSRRRVVLFTTGHTEPNGGLAKHSRLLVEGMAAAGLEVRAISRTGTYRRPKLTRGDHLVVLELPGFRAPRLGAALYLAVGIPLGIVWTRKAIGCLAVHLGSTTVAAGVSASVWRRPFIALSTSSGPGGEVAEAVACRPGGLRRRILRRANRLVAQSWATAPELAPLTTSDRVAVVPNPVELPVAPPLTGCPRVLYLGRLSIEKDPDTLLRAWRLVVAECPEARLRFVGIGGDWRPVEQDVRESVDADPALAATVSFAGWVDDVGSVLAGHDVFVQCSTSEGMSNSLLEACAHGRVVVASAIPSNVAVLGDDYPLLFEAGDADALAALLLEAIRSDDVARDAAARCRRAVEANSVSSVVARHLALLGETTSS